MFSIDIKIDSVIKEKQTNKHLNQRFFLILENFINEFTVSKSHPEVAVYSNALEDTRGAYQKLESDIFLQRNNLETLNEILIFCMLRVYLQEH